MLAVSVVRRSAAPVAALGRSLSVGGAFEAVRKYVWPEFHEIRPLERQFFAFAGAEDMKRWQATSDASVGGKSQFTFEQINDFGLLTCSCVVYIISHAFL